MKRPAWRTVSAAWRRPASPSSSARPRRRGLGGGGGKEKQKAAQAAKAAKAEKARKATTENGRIGDRPYARGRSFNADHYGE